jgi:hypothetical protein
MHPVANKEDYELIKTLATTSTYFGARCRPLEVIVGSHDYSKYSGSTFIQTDATFRSTYDNFWKSNEPSETCEESVNCL